jgi:hypothetical protein
MMDQFKEVIRNYTDEQLFDQYTRHREEYLPEVQALLDAEFKKRNLDTRQTAPSDGAEPEIETIHLDSKDFKPFDHVFNRIDLQLATAILRENGIVFYIDNPKSTDTIPLEDEASKPFTIHVHERVFDKAHELLDEHFEKSDGRYRAKNMGVKDRLRSFSFNDLHLSEIEAAEIIEVDFTAEEKSAIVAFGKKVLEECDKIEAEQSRVIFYYDTIEDLIGHLSSDGELLLSRTELLTILEILQIFLDDAAFPSFMNESISTLLSFFMN